MKRQLIVLAIGSLFALPAFAAPIGELGYPPQPAATASHLSKAQVQNEIRANVQKGDNIVNWATLAKDKQVWPNFFPHQAATATKSSAQVLDELRAAQRTGNVVANAETGQKANQLYPSLYAAGDTDNGQRAN